MDVREEVRLVTDQLANDATDEHVMIPESLGIKDSNGKAQVE